MNWKDLLISRRTGRQTPRIEHSRSEFQRDYDRIIFSAPFRRLQNKTQVFPLPGSVFVHNRLTHSIEVASVGRSLGSTTAALLSKQDPDNADYFESFSPIVSAGALAHDMGNPPFGHSGERAIQHYFANGKGQDLANHLTKAQLADVSNFDGNANTFRLLSHSFAGRRQGGFSLTYPTLASIIKYPRPAVGVKKFGFFQQDAETFCGIMQTLNIPHAPVAEHIANPDGTVSQYTFARHPLVYLVEAADDICYQAMDVEDAYRLGIFGYEETRHLYMSYFDPDADAQTFDNLELVCRNVTDPHEQVAYMRTLVIGRLVNEAAKIFCNNVEDILAGRFQGSLLHHLEGTSHWGMKQMASTAVERIYRHQTVAQVELSGFAIIGTLTDKFIDALIHQDRYYSQLLLPFIPDQFRVGPDATVYDKVMSAVDTVSGMTDLYALDLYKRIMGTDVHI